MRPPTPILDIEEPKLPEPLAIPMSADADTSIEIATGALASPSTPALAEPPRLTAASILAKIAPRRRKRRLQSIAIALVVLAVLGVGGWKLRQIFKAGRLGRDGMAYLDRGVVSGAAPTLRDAVRTMRTAVRRGASGAELVSGLAWGEALLYLEHGEGDVRRVRAAIQRAAPEGEESPSLDLARAALALATSAADTPGRLDKVREDPAGRYLAALGAERANDPRATEQLRLAAESPSSLFFAKVALALRFLEVEDLARARSLAVELATGAAPLGWAASALVDATTGDPTEAATRARTVLERPQDLGRNGRTLARLALSRALRRKGDAAQAKSLLGIAVSAPTTDPRLARFLAEEAVLAGSPELAEVAALRAVELAPRQTSGLRGLAAVHLVRRAPEKALALLEKTPTSDRASTLLRARALIEAGRPSEAVPIARSLLEASPTDLEARLLLLRARARGGEALEAQRGIPSVEVQYGSDRRVLLGVADVLLHADEPEAALRRVSKLLERDPTDAEALLLRGAALRAMEQPEAARQAYLAAQAASPDLVEGLVLAAEIERERGRFPEAKQIYEKALGTPRGRVPASLGAAEVALALGELEAASRHAAVADAAGVSADVPILRAKIALVRGNAREAVELIDRVAAQGPLDPPLLALRGEARRRVGDVDGARADFEAALRADRSLPHAVLGLGELELALGNQPDARRLADRGFLLGRRDVTARARALVLIGRLALEKGKAGKPFADRCFRGALGIAPLHADAHYFSGLVRAAEPAAAAPFLRRYLELAPGGPWSADARRLLGAAGAGNE